MDHLSYFSYNSCHGPEATMKSVAATEAKNRLRAILDEAQREPIVRRLREAPERSRRAVQDHGRADRGDGLADRRAAGGAVASTEPGGRNACSAGVGVRGQVPATEDAQ